MNEKDFYSIYIPALERAFENDNINYGFYVKSPEDYLNDDLSRQITNYLETNEDSFTERVSYYFDAKSHNFPSIQNISIEDYKVNLIKDMLEVKKKFLIV
ncbi:hypothetical protein EG359_10425 [Chryseobacterium joostei]|uniref:Uncharacterized protein n=1 Tax=Chryseobacterium joostei TaxID=112234 RepID=A0A1N7IGA5_9FLAO|nr:MULTISPECIES: hypothetical protein [Chryseobacterium]AZB00013.1 hypothetical protein EG359_10425 [Chryseobacterium joostei]SIS35981.1 hypothetical protein SAMN05421768_1052 [Chryseobacterium joostei]HCM33453.1 hypothetical protein [Chryseobacterium sp.]